jgi:hypothetical protein
MSSNRKVAIDGNGLVVSQGETAIGNLTEVTAPGWTKTVIDDTALDNVGVTTSVLGNLADWDSLDGTIKLGGESVISAGNSLWTVKFPNGASLAFWGDVQSQGRPQVQNGSSIAVPVSIKVTNLSGGAIVAPVFTSGGIVTSGAIVSSGGQA